MNEQASRKIIVAGAMAVVVGIGVMTVAMRPHTLTHTAKAITPPAPLSESPAAAEAVAPTPELATAVAPAAPIVEAPVTPVPKDTTVSKRAAVRPARMAPDLSMATAAAAVAVANSSESTQGAAASSTAQVPETLPMPAPAVTADQKADTAAMPAASDSEITANVKSEIAVDGVGKSEAIDVITSDGVVTLTGNLASQDEIEHIKVVVARVKDVKSVDTSALSLPAT